MTTDIVDRLRGKYAMGPHQPNGNPEFGWRQFEATPINLEAAAEIERLRKALEPFASFAENVDEDGWTSGIHRERISVWFGPSDFRRAKEAANA